MVPPASVKPLSSHLYHIDINVNQGIPHFLSGKPSLSPRASQTVYQGISHFLDLCVLWLMCLDDLPIWTGIANWNIVPSKPTKTKHNVHTIPIFLQFKYLYERTGFCHYYHYYRYHYCYYYYYYYYYIIIIIIIIIIIVIIVLFFILCYFDAL